MNALLQPINGWRVTEALGRAYRAFREREGFNPEWLALGEGVKLRKGRTGPLGLLRRNVPVRANCILVGVGEDDDTETTAALSRLQERQPLVGQPYQPVDLLEMWGGADPAEWLQANQPPADVVVVADGSGGEAEPADRGRVNEIHLP